MIQDKIKFRIAINGRFLTRQPTGVDRFAIEVLRAIDLLCQHNNNLTVGLTFEILVPRGIDIPYKFLAIPVRHVGFFQGQVWEQLDLPLVTMGSLLINLCNTAPILRRKQLVVIHDAATVRAPNSYGNLFKLWYKLLIPTIYRRAFSVCTVSNFSRDELASVYGVRSPVAILPEGTDHMHRVQSDFSILDRHNLNKKPYILAVSSQSPHKNFGVVIKAVELIGDADLDVVIAGGCNPRVFAQSDDKLPASVKYVGYVSDAELKGLYERALCFVFPSLYEGYGLPPTEAMACYCPVLASKAASIPEICGDAAVYFDPHDPSDLVRTLVDFMYNRAHQLQMKSRGLAKANTMDWNKAALALLSEIRRMK